MEYVYWILDGLLAGRPGPVECPWDLDNLYAAGIRAVVSLNAEPDPAGFAAAGLRHHSLPMTPSLPVVAPLQDLLLRELEPVLAAIHAEVSAGVPTLVHCHAGKDRTGLVLAAYLVRYHHLDVEEAIARVRAVKPTAMSAPGYEATARRFAEQEGHKRPMSDLKVAAIQMDAQAGQIEANLAHAQELVEQAAGQGAQLIVLPELFNAGYEYTDRNWSLPEPLDGPTGTWIVATAQRLGVHLVGSFPARIGSKAYIVAQLAAPGGRKWVYYKNHVALWENLYFERGNWPLIAETDLGRIGLLICWDQVFANLARAYQGRVDLLCVPSSPPTFIGQVEDAGGQALLEIKRLRFLGQEVDGVAWFDRARRAHARHAGVPLVYAARCGEFHSPIPYGWSFLLTLGPREAWRVLRAVGTDYRLRCPMQGRSCILDAQGEPLVGAEESGEAVLVATVQPGAPDLERLPPVPRGRAAIPGIPWFQFLLDDWLILLGRWVRRRPRPGGT